MAPGEGVRSLGTGGEARVMGGTSVAAPFVTRAVALLWSLFAAAPASQVRTAVTGGCRARRRSVVPPLLDAWAAYRALARMYGEHEGGGATRRKDAPSEVGAGGVHALRDEGNSRPYDPSCGPFADTGSTGRIDHAHGARR